MKMSDSFNPYHKWLGIPLEEQPANLYRLLAVAPFESDPDVIESAADQRMAHLRTFQAGKHSALSQKLLNEVAAAKVCLLRPDKKAAYDAQLRDLLNRQSSGEDTSSQTEALRELSELLGRSTCPATGAVEETVVPPTAVAGLRHWWGGSTGRPHRMEPDRRQDRGRS